MCCALGYWLIDCFFCFVFFVYLVFVYLCTVFCVFRVFLPIWRINVLISLVNFFVISNKRIYLLIYWISISISISRYFPNIVSISYGHRNSDIDPSLLYKAAILKWKLRDRKLYMFYVRQNSFETFIKSISNRRDSLSIWVVVHIIQSSVIVIANEMMGNYTD